jgi:hypothetical protein
MSMIKKVFAIMIAVALFVVYLPFGVAPAFATDGQENTNEPGIVAAEEPIDTEIVDLESEVPAEMNAYVDNVTASAADISWDAVEDAAYYSVSLGDGDSVLVTSDVLNYGLIELTSNTEYTVKVAAYGEDDTVIGEKELIFTTSDGNAPEKVKKFRTVSSYNSVILKWKKSDDVDGYKITWSGSNGAKGTINKKADATKHVFKISDKNRKVKYTFKIAAVKDGVASEKVTKKDSSVQLMTLKVTLKPRGGGYHLKSHDKYKTVTYNKLKAGDTIETIGFTNGKYVFQKKVGGKLRTFHVTRISVKNQKVNYIGKYKKKNGWKVVQPIYTKEEAESFVNTIGVSSKTKHLIWVNQYSQRLFVFKGSKGKWKLVKQCYKDEGDGAAGWPVASGKPTSPTSTGKTSIKQRDLGGSGKVPFWNVTTWFSIHGNSENYWGPLGWPKSGACCRNTTPHAKWIYYNTKMHTAVYVY